MANFPLFDTQVCLIGHSHVQLGFRLGLAGHCERFLPHSGHTMKLQKHERYFINPGSVGQPRDQDPRAAYIVYDTDAGTIRFNRIEYDINQTQLQMRNVDLPMALVRRLELGM
jgi:diadenosine tetraphosphatase ApaH/serine/threonine PP2A family protein phosphatase